MGVKKVVLGAGILESLITFSRMVLNKECAGVSSLWNLSLAHID
jgi:hypothetical protein